MSLRDCLCDGFTALRGRLVEIVLMKSLIYSEGFYCRRSDVPHSSLPVQGGVFLFAILKRLSSLRRKQEGGERDLPAPDNWLGPGSHSPICPLKTLSLSEQSRAVKIMAQRNTPVQFQYKFKFKMGFTGKIKL